METSLAESQTDTKWPNSYPKQKDVSDKHILPLIQEGQLSVSGEECAQYWLTAEKTKPAQ